MPDGSFVKGTNSNAPFSLKVHRGEGMVLLAMDWKTGKPPKDFVGFSIEYRYPQKSVFWPVRNRIHFPGKAKPTPLGKPPEQYPSTEAPFQIFRWVHFPKVADTPGVFTYRVTPRFMNSEGILAAGVPQQVDLEIYSETDPGKINIAFTRGYVSSQSFVDRFGGEEGFGKLIPPTADAGNDFVPTHDKADEAYQWMGFEARERILDLLDKAIAKQADVMVVAYELNLPELIGRFAKIGSRLRIIIDDSVSTSKKKDGTVVIKDKGAPHSPESRAEAVLKAAGAKTCRQHMGVLQHNKMIIVDGPNFKRVVLGSTNFSWRGFFVQSNNAVIVYGSAVVAQQREAFEAYWEGSAESFGASQSSRWLPLQVDGLDAEISMSPHKAANSTQAAIAADMDSASSSLFYSLAFLNITSGPVTDAVVNAIKRPDLFVYGVSDKRKGIVLLQPDGNPEPVSAASLGKGMPEPFRSEASGGSGVKMHHKFVVIDFDKPSARVYTGSYNFSKPADRSNGENLLVIRNRRIATAYMVEALRIFDAYQFRVSSKKKPAPGVPAKKIKELGIPPVLPGEKPWWDKFWSVPIKAKDRKIFA
ncbi:MAG TPA: phospholipase D-like domain-containing protein [Sphingomicrobium sp.]|nr:phospholipase D-like domain-containing protein [Sphingomicrobium sp.]